MALDEATLFVESTIDMRRARRATFPSELFLGEQGWDILLALFVADAHGERLSARQLLTRVGGPFGSGERWIRFLNDQGLTIGDGQGRLDDVVTATPEALQRIETWAAGSMGVVERLVAPHLERRRRQT